jgi:hypothetical protein
MLERSAPATWLNGLSYKGKPVALGKGVAHWGGAVAKRCCWRGTAWEEGGVVGVDIDRDYGEGGWCVAKPDDE